MTREDLCKMLELFAVCVIQTTMTDLDTDAQHDLIAAGIEDVANTVMFCTDKSRYISPSIN